MKLRNVMLTCGVLLSSLSLAVCLAADVGMGEKLSMSVTNRYGDILTNLTVGKVLGDGLLLQHKAGQIKVKYADLPQAVREKYEPLATAAVNKEKQNRETDAAFSAGLRQGMADIEKARAIREKQSKGNESTSAGNLPNLSIEIPNQGWKITVLNPGLKVLGRQSSVNQFVYRAFGRDNFLISIFVEKPDGKGGGHSDVFNYYWPKASRNPLIDEKSVKTETKGKFVKVSYTSLDIPNANYYFAFQDRWVDVHISGDKKLLAEFEEQLSYGQ